MLPVPSDTCIGEYKIESLGTKDAMYKGDYKSGSIITHIFRCAGSPLDLSDVRIVGATHKSKQDGISLQEGYLDDFYRLNIDTSKHTDFFVRGDYTVIVRDMIFEFSLENRYMRGTDGSNLVVPDKEGVRDIQFAGIAQTLEGIMVLLNSRAPAHEYDKQLDTTISSRSPSGEYDGQLDKKLSSLSPKGEYLIALMGLGADLSPKGEYDMLFNTFMDNLFRTLADIQNDTQKVVDKLPNECMTDVDSIRKLHGIVTLLKNKVEEDCGHIKGRLQMMSSSGGVVLASEQPNYAPAVAGVPVDVSQDVLNAIQSLIMDIRVFDPTGTPDVSCAWIEALSYFFAEWRNIKEVYNNKIIIHKNTGEKLLERDITTDGVKRTWSKWQT